jgi:hypothetical protein
MNKFWKDLLDFFDNPLPVLKEGEKYCIICHGEQWISSHCGDDRCLTCNATGIVKK